MLGKKIVMDSVASNMCSVLYSSEGMTDRSQGSAHSIAVKVYGEFMENCVMHKVISDRVGESGKGSPPKIDGRPIRLVTISGKGGWSD